MNVVVVVMLRWQRESCSSVSVCTATGKIKMIEMPLGLPWSFTWGFTLLLIKDMKESQEYVN